MLINNDNELTRMLLKSLLPGLMEFLAIKVENVLKANLNLADISTSTLQDYVVHESHQEGNKFVSTIYIDDVLAQEQRAGNKTYGNLVEFVSIDGSISYGGKSIVWNMINWLEKTGANGPIGNNPIRPISMFQKTEDEVRGQLDNWVKKYLKSKGF